MIHPMIRTAALFAAVILFAAPALPAQTDGDLHIEQLNLGEYWGGAPIDKRDLIGKVTLVEIWGS